MGFFEALEKWIGFTQREFEDKSAWIFRDLGRNALTLAGFSFASIFFIFNYYKDNLPAGAFTINSLFLCALLFLFSSEVAREGWRIWKYLVSEIMYLFSTVILFLVLWVFISSAGIMWWLFFGLAEILILGFFCCRAIYSMYVMVDLYKNHVRPG